MRVLVGLSGGLDSTFTAYTLKQQGYQVDGIHFSNGLVTDETVDTIRHIAKFLGITVIFVDIKEQFTQLLHRVDIEMCHRKTPNICVMCAKYIKFDYILGYAMSYGYDYFATGHYVRILNEQGKVTIKKGIDPTRDQSYGFGIIPKDNMNRVLTPLGSLIKTDIRKMADDLGLPYIHKESRGLCFTDVPFSEFYTKYAESSSGSGMIQGKFIAPDGHSWDHKGQQLYTIGQKVSYKGHSYVIGLKLPSGNIVITEKMRVLKNIIKITKIVGKIDEIMDKPIQIQVRYNTNPVTCHIIDRKYDSLTVETDSPVYAPTDGQVGTIYSGDEVILGGIISND